MKIKPFGYWKIGIWLLFGYCYLVIGNFSAYALNLDKAEVYFLSEDYFSAIDECEALLSRYKDHRELDRLYYILGISYMKAGNLLRAGDIFDIIINEYPQSELVADACVSRGDVHMLAGDLRKARESYAYIVKDRSGSDIKPLAYYKLAQACMKQGDWQGSRTYFDALSRDFPLSFESRLSRSVQEGNDFFTVQVGAFQGSANAEKLKGALKKKGFSSYVVEENGGSGKFYKVRVGKVKSRSEALKLERQLAGLGYPTRICP